MKILMMTDLEGAAGVVSFDGQTRPDTPGYARACDLLTQEVNAAVDGLFSAGAEEVLVVDGHGPGGITFELLDERAALLHGRPLAPREVRKRIDARYDATVIIGAHAMAGTVDGNLCHTQNSRAITAYRLNGKLIGETAQWALYCGSMGLPLIYLSGDHAACREVRELIEDLPTTAVKESLNRSSAISMAAPAARKAIRHDAAAALKAHRKTPVAPLKWDGPYCLEKTFYTPELADGQMAHPAAVRVDALTVRFESDDIAEIVYI